MTHKKPRKSNIELSESAFERSKQSQLYVRVQQSKRKIHQRKPKCLRDLYTTDKAANEFLLKHPEFNDRFLEQSEVAHPGFNTQEGRYTLNEVKEDLKEYGDMMLQAASALPDNHVYKMLLDDYYNGVEFSELRKKYGARTRNALNQRLSRARKAALKAYNKTRLIGPFHYPPLKTRVFTLRGATKFVYLVYNGREGVWVNEEGRSLPEYAQDILNYDS